MYLLSNCCASLHRARDEAVKQEKTADEAAAALKKLIALQQRLEKANVVA